MRPRKPQGEHAETSATVQFDSSVASGRHTAPSDAVAASAEGRAGGGKNGVSIHGCDVVQSGSGPLLAVTEIFASLQGEGPFMGQPAVFVRLAGCVPPFCAWCDTPQALHADDCAMPMTPQAVLEAVLRHPYRMVVITGGEPFRQWDAGLSILADILAGVGRTIQYETSGKAGIPADCGGFVVCSPKPADAAMGGCAGALALAAGDAARVDAFKFVIDCRTGHEQHDENAALRSVLDFIGAHAVSPDKVWLMPRGSRKDEQLRNMALVWELCVQHGFNFAPRLHILTFDDRKGI
ncbi:7-carboxy-7-deazaguanine synthase QueE [Desulfovibrio mangrovi]|uniref:7-carboxy-7-deazaguanine synthase QueE n=1 Tax=Desulfovibrio mangrovi TaxID=2976983 RepID=UPI0022453557|nr:7-carboxy-7-deazaguanine synthase QueE [Desulfovibrio mangrovi]UZP66996.1 7-carboxy-7-deazaguanine synthase QueE [Desulfovibrio mangrovi]